MCVRWKMVLSSFILNCFTSFTLAWLLGKTPIIAHVTLIRCRKNNSHRYSFGTQISCSEAWNLRKIPWIWTLSKGEEEIRFYQNDIQKQKSFTSRISAVLCDRRYISFSMIIVTQRPLGIHSGRRVKIGMGTDRGMRFEEVGSRHGQPGSRGREERGASFELRGI